MIATAAAVFVMTTPAWADMPIYDVKDTAKLWLPSVARPRNPS